MLRVGWVEGFERVQNWFDNLERPLAIRQLVPVLPKGKDCVEAFFVGGGTLLDGLRFGLSYESGEVVNNPAAQRIGSVAKPKLANQLFPERKDRVRGFGCDRLL